MRLILKALCVFLLVMILMAILFGQSTSDLEEHSAAAKKSKATSVTKEQSLVVNYVNAVGHCLRIKTRVGAARSTPQALEELWRILPAASDSCSVNAQISLRSYATPGQYNIYFIQNMNTTLASTTCTVVSLENSQNSEAEERLLAENDKCRLLAISETQVHSDTDRMKHLPMNVVSTRTDGILGDGEGIIGLIRNRVGNVVDMLMIGTEKNSYEYLKMILTDANDDTNGVTICQVNLLYHEPRTHEIPQFLEVVRSLTRDERYILIRADRDRQSMNMQLFFVNHREPYCLDRYLRMYSFD